MDTTTLAQVKSEIDELREYERRFEELRAAKAWDEIDALQAAYAAKHSIELN